MYSSSNAISRTMVPGIYEYLESGGGVDADDDEDDAVAQGVEEHVAWPVHRVCLAHVLHAPTPTPTPKTAPKTAPSVTPTRAGRRQGRGHDSSGHPHRDIELLHHHNLNPLKNSNPCF